MMPWLDNPNALWAASGCAALGVLGGVVGTFLLLRRRVLLADAVSHATLPGVVVAFLGLYAAGAPRSLVVLLGGGLVSGLLGALTVPVLRRHGRMKDDAAIACVLALWYAAGAFGMGLVQVLPGGGQAGLEKFLLGQAAAILPADARLLAGGALLVLALVAAFYKELRLAAFDPDFASVSGFRAGRLDALLLLLTALTVTLALPAVGLVLAVAMVVIPPAAARFWSDRLWAMLAAAAGLGLAAGLLGTALSTVFRSLPTGPAIVLVLASAFALSAAFAPRRGFLPRALRRLLAARRTQEEDALANLWRSEEDRRTPAPLAAALFARLLRHGWVDGSPQGPALSAAGRDHARQLVRTHRLWETYLHAQAHLPHLHEAAHRLEHVPPPADLAKEAGAATDPHGKPIPAADGSDIGEARP